VGEDWTDVRRRLTGLGFTVTVTVTVTSADAGNDGWTACAV
jgi:hypothetical protein